MHYSIVSLMFVLHVYTFLVYLLLVCYAHDFPCISKYSWLLYQGRRSRVGKGASAPPTLRLGGLWPPNFVRKKRCTCILYAYARTFDCIRNARDHVRRLANSRLRTADLSNEKTIISIFGGGKLNKVLSRPPIFIVSQPPLYTVIQLTISLGIPCPVIKTNPTVVNAS